MPVKDTHALSTDQQHMLAIINERIPSLEHGINYTSEMIAPASLWNSLTDGSRRVFGKDLSNMVDRGLFPLMKTSPPYKMPVTYQRI